jgi:hypothetical protein
MAGMQTMQDKAMADLKHTDNQKRETERALRDAEMDALPKVIRNLMTAHKLGRLDTHAECVDILNDISTCLMNGCTRFSSAYSEYIFQYGRMAQTNSPVISVLGWWRHLKHYLYQQFLEAGSGFALPASVRGIPHTIDARIRIPVTPLDWHATDADLTARVDRGVERAQELLQGCGVDTSTARLRGFFARPCKHYPLTDSYVTSAACEESNTANKEDDPNTDDNSGADGGGSAVIDLRCG